jgi:hypothetical protein
MKTFTRRSALSLGAAALGLLIVPARGNEGGSEVTVWKDPYCGCCGGWIAHMEASGFQVQSVDLEDMEAFKDQRGVPADLRSCHTAEVEGYLIEGHVPAAAITALLAARPSAVQGLAVAGMPSGSPGMEGPEGSPSDQYDVIAFGEGQQSVFLRFAGGRQLEGFPREG